jgi:F-type H+-transporting ATPase subunit a
VSIVWKSFDLAIGAIQAFIFALLTILYFDVAMSTAHADDHATVAHGAPDHGSPVEVPVAAID